MNIYFRLITSISLALTLGACGANETSDSVLKETTASDELTGASLQSACTDEIKTKLLDPSTADISYRPLSNINGLAATIKVINPSDESMITSEFTCTAKADGSVKVTLLAD